ncbi:hypothetical protein CKO42_03865 [Lamprobacter modestohalophilus]|uniref:DNA-binding protein n=1 Tax=Lamprobacter modestohalophilus TaxID=1064514 RepID=A0A9X0W680_9GAMM|nr:hypothetical protein [Lamprobacter modestohalophilus]MBK1617602.1 hypothetical protein [Lamprobacter modestohalophilus]
MDQPTVNHWRSIGAMAEIVNAGAKKPTLSEHALRHYVRTAEQNGLSPHIRRLGRKILIHEQGFLSWLSGEGRREAA